MLRAVVPLAYCCWLLLVGVLASPEETNHRHHVRAKRSFLSSLFGRGTAESETHPPTPGTMPYMPYPVWVMPSPGAAGPSPYMAMAAPGDGNYPVAWMSQQQQRQHLPLDEQVDTDNRVDQPRSAYLDKLNLSPAEELQLKEVAQQLGITDYDHLPPFDDVMALLGTTSKSETIKAVKEYAATPDGLALIKDYVTSYQPAKRISLGEQPKTVQPQPTTTIAPTPSAVTVPSAAPESDSGFFARLNRLKSFFSFGSSAPDSTSGELTESEVGNELPVPLVYQQPPPGPHYFIPVRPLVHGTNPDRKYSPLPFPLHKYAPVPVRPHLQDVDPFPVRKDSIKRQTGVTKVTPSPSSPEVYTVAPKPVEMTVPSIVTTSTESLITAEPSEPPMTTTSTEDQDTGGDQ